MACNLWTVYIGNEYISRESRNYILWSKIYFDFI